MALSGWSSSNYGEGTALLTAPPLSVSAMVAPANNSGVQTVMFIGNSGSNQANQQFKLSLSGGKGEFLTGASGWSFAQTSNTAATGQWNHLAGGAIAANSRWVKLNAGAKATDATSRTPSGINRTCIGITRHTASQEAFSGAIAEVGIWNVTLSDEELALLGAGVPPPHVRTDGLVDYFPLVRDFVATRSGLLTLAGSPTAADHPPVFVIP